MNHVIPYAVNINVGENEIIRLIVPNDATGNVTLVIDNEEYSFALPNGALGTAYVEGEKYTVAVSGGNGEITISGLPKGEYFVSVKYNGDYKYLPSENSTIFAVSKIDAKMDVIDEGNGTIKVILPDDATGNVAVKVDDKTYSVPVKNGTATVTLDNTTPGVHDVEINYSGDYNYSSKTTKTTVDVPKYETPISVSVEDIYVGDTAVVTVTVPDDATGNVIIEINGVEHSSEIRDGKAVFNVKDLAFGNKTVAVTYHGDNNYLENFTTGQFEVIKRPSTVNAESKDIKTGKDEVITLTVPDDATGRVLVNIDGVGYYANVVNGKAKVIVPNLKAGSYTAAVTCEGDDKYLPSNTTTSFNVAKSSAPISAIGDEIEVGEDAVVVVDLPNDATGTVTIRIDGRTYTTEVVDCMAMFVIPGLSVGIYPVDVHYSGDDNYPANDTVTYVIVNDSSDRNGTNISARAGVELSSYPTGNPILIALFAMLSIESVRIRRFRK